MWDSVFDGKNNNIYSHGSKVVVFTTLFKVFVPKVYFYLMFLRSYLPKVIETKIIRPGFHFEVPQKCKVATKIISYERYGEILFQKVASGYLLHLLQDGSSKNAL